MDVERRMSDLSPLPSVRPGRYSHYKGKEYEVLGIVRHSETLETMVLCRPLYNDSGLWVRPFECFSGRSSTKDIVSRGSHQSTDRHESGTYGCNRPSAMRVRFTASATESNS